MIVMKKGKKTIKKEPNNQNKNFDDMKTKKLFNQGMNVNNAVVQVKNGLSKEDQAFFALSGDFEKIYKDNVKAPNEFLNATGIHFNLFLKDTKFKNKGIELCFVNQLILMAKHYWQNNESHYKLFLDFLEKSFENIFFNVKYFLASEPSYTDIPEDVIGGTQIDYQVLSFYI